MNSLQNSNPYLVICLKCNSCYRIPNRDAYTMVRSSIYHCDCLNKFLQESLSLFPNYTILAKDPLFKILDTEISRVLYS